MFIWLIVAVLAAIGEVLTTGLFLATVAVAAAITAVLAILFPGVIQIIAFAGLTLGGLAVVRPLVVRTLGLETALFLPNPAGHSHIMGRRAVVTRAVDAGGGQVRIGDGEFWSARAFDPDDRLEVGSSAEIVLVDGLTAVVSPLPALPQSDSTVSSQTGES